jgi:hypothetical protein
VATAETAARASQATLAVEELGVVESDGRLRRHRAADSQLLAGEPALAEVVDELDQADGAVLEDERHECHAVRADMAQIGEIGSVGSGIAHVDDLDALLVQDLVGHREPLGGEGLSVGPAPTAAVVVGEHVDGARLGVEL